MAFSGLLKITQIGLNQANAYITHNDAIDDLEEAANRRKLSGGSLSGTWTIAEADFIRNFSFVAEVNTANFDIVLPATVNSATTQRVYAVRNASAFTATVKSSGSPVATVSLLAGQSALVEQNGTSIFTLALWNGRTTAPYNVAAYKPGLPTASEVIFQFVTPTAFTLADNFAGSQGYVEVNPTASATFDVKKNGTNIGTVVVGTGGGFTFATSGTGLETFSVGDRLTVAAPGTPDATLSGFHVAFAGTRTI